MKCLPQSLANRGNAINSNYCCCFIDSQYTWPLIKNNPLSPLYHFTLYTSLFQLRRLSTDSGHSVSQTRATVLSLREEESAKFVSTFPSTCRDVHTPANRVTTDVTCSNTTAVCKSQFLHWKPTILGNSSIQAKVTLGRSDWLQLSFSFTVKCYIQEETITRTKQW